jgi:hypothetical protein
MVGIPGHQEDTGGKLVKSTDILGTRLASSPGELGMTLNSWACRALRISVTKPARLFVCLFVFRQCHRNSLGRPGWPQISRGWLALSSAGTRGVLPMLCSAYCSFLRLGFVVSPGCPETPGLKPSSCFTLPRSRDNRHVSTVPQLAGEYHCAPAGRHVPPCPSGLKV